MGWKLLADTISPCNKAERIPQDQTIKVNSKSTDNLLKYAGLCSSNIPNNNHDHVILDGT